MRPDIIKLVTETLVQIVEDMEIENVGDITPETRLYGSKSALDSMALVSLVAEVESRVSDYYGKNIVLADEKAMSQTRSPFRDVESLADYIETLLSEG